MYSCSETQSQVQYNYKEPNAKIAAKAKGIEISREELDKTTKLEIYELENQIFKIRESQIKQMLLAKIVNEQKDKGTLSTQDYLEQKVLNKIKVPKAEIDKFIKEQNFPAAQINDQFKSQVEQYLARDKKREHLESWLGRKIGSDVDLFIEKPERPLFELPAIGDSPVYGQKDAPVTIYEYSDFQCPHCKDAVDTINEIKKKYPKKVKVVYKHYPLPNHKDAKTASIATMCVKEQDEAKFWPFHNLLFKNQQKLSVEDIKKYAKEFKLDEKKFNDCLDQQKYVDFIEKDVKEGNEVGIRSTPTFFVNGRIIMGNQSVETFEEEIKKFL
jgi:protein-disulfide isomerase